MDTYRNVRRAIEKECCRHSLLELCEAWGFHVDDFEAYLDAADEALKAQGEDHA